MRKPESRLALGELISFMGLEGVVPPPRRGRLLVVKCVLGEFLSHEVLAAGGVNSAVGLLEFPSRD